MLGMCLFFFFLSKHHDALWGCQVPQSISAWCGRTPNAPSPGGSWVVVSWRQSVPDLGSCSPVVVQVKSILHEIDVSFLLACARHSSRASACHSLQSPKVPRWQSESRHARKPNKCFHVLHIYFSRAVIGQRVAVCKALAPAIFCCGLVFFFFGQFSPILAPFPFRTLAWQISHWSEFVPHQLAAAPLPHLKNGPLPPRSMLVFCTHTRQLFSQPPSNSTALFSASTLSPSPTYIMTGRKFYMCPPIPRRVLISGYRRQGRQGSRQGRCQAPPEDSSWQHPGHHQARHPSSRSSWWCQAYLGQ